MTLNTLHSILFNAHILYSVALGIWSGVVAYRSQSISGSFWGAVVGGLLVGLCVGLTGAYASEWSLLSMYILLVAVVTFRARGLWGKKSVLEA